MVTQIKKERKTPFGTLTNDYVEKLPEPRQPWPPPPSSTAQAVVPPPLPPKKATVSVPVSPYVAQLKARYDAYNAAGGKPAGVRISVGYEDLEDIKADIDQAFAVARA